VNPLRQPVLESIVFECHVNGIRALVANQIHIKLRFDSYKSVTQCLGQRVVKLASQAVCNGVLSSHHPLLNLEGTFSLLVALNKSIMLSQSFVLAIVVFKASHCFHERVFFIVDLEDETVRLFIYSHCLTVVDLEKVTLDLRLVENSNDVPVDNFTGHI
jgi:hypothetical protein